LRTAPPPTNCTGIVTDSMRPWGATSQVAPHSLQRVSLPSPGKGEGEKVSSPALGDPTLTSVVVKTASFPLRLFARIGIEPLHAVHYHAPGQFLSSVEMLAPIGAGTGDDGTNCWLLYRSNPRAKIASVLQSLPQHIRWRRKRSLQFEFPQISLIAKIDC
jgi:hypothetical protein